MSKRIFIILFGILLAVFQPADARLIGIHSHNDYNRKSPFFDAYKAHAASIEADVFLVDGELYVAHDREDIRSWRTLRNLYLDPIRQLFRANGGAGYADGSTYQLIVDLKDGRESLLALQRMIEEEYAECFDTEHNPRAITLTVSGDLIPAEHFADYPDFIKHDGRVGRTYTQQQLKHVSVISQDLRKFFSWDGECDLTKAEIDSLRTAARDVHRMGKKIRFWAMPDSPKAWQLAKHLRLDFINTDNPAKVRKYLKRR